MQKTWLKKWLSNRESRLAVTLLLGGLLVRSTIALFLPPGFDESYYYLYTQHPDWSYFDHPVLVALSTGFGPFITGNVSQFTLRLGALLVHTGALWLLYLTSLHLFSRRAAVLTLAIATLSPIFLVGFGVLTLPDAPLIFFWTATILVAAYEFFPKPVTYNQTPPSSYTTHSRPPTPDSRLPTPYAPTYRLAIIGLLVGLACLSKYHGAALGFGLIGFCLTSPRHRHALTSPWILLSLGLFLVTISPILFWNAQHNWVSLRFQSGRAVPDRGYSLLDLLVTFLAGVAYLFPTLGFPLWWVSGKALWEQVVRGRRDKGARGVSQFKISTIPDSRLPITNSRLPTPDSRLPTPDSRLLLWLSLPLMLVFTLMGGYRSILPTWAMPGFWTATLLLGWKAADWQQKAPRLLRRWLRGTGIAVFSLLLIALLHVNLGTLQKSSRYALFGGILSPKADASTQLIDIKQLRAGFTELPQLQNALRSTDYLFTNDLYLAGQIGVAFAPLPHKPITCFDQDPRGFAFWSTDDKWVGKDGLLVTPEQKAETTLTQYQSYFKDIQKIADIPIYRGGVVIQVIQVYRCDRLLKPYPKPY